MSKSRARLEWQQTAQLLSMLEGCRMNEAAFDREKWLPPSLRDETPPPTAVKDPDQRKRELVEFDEYLKAGRG